jgi:hypothetical protein
MARPNVIIEENNKLPDQREIYVRPNEKIFPNVDRSKKPLNPQKFNDNILTDYSNIIKDGKIDTDIKENERSIYTQQKFVDTRTRIAK